MEGQCQLTFEKVAQVYSIAKALGRGWEHLDEERRVESLEGLASRVIVLQDSGKARKEDARAVLLSIEGLLKYRVKPEQVHEIPSKLEKPIIEMAIHSIADCECAEPADLSEKPSPEWQAMTPQQKREAFRKAATSEPKRHDDG